MGGLATQSISTNGANRPAPSTPMWCVQGRRFFGGKSSVGVVGRLRSHAPQIPSGKRAFCQHGVTGPNPLRSGSTQGSASPAWSAPQPPPAAVGPGRWVFPRVRGAFWPREGITSRPFPRMEKGATGRGASDKRWKVGVISFHRPFLGASLEDRRAVVSDPIKAQTKSKPNCDKTHSVPQIHRTMLPMHVVRSSTKTFHVVSGDPHACDCA